MSQSQKHPNNDSPGKRIWNNFLKNKTAVFGIAFILLMIFIGLFAYILAPDPTPNANDQIPEIALQKPGFTISILKVKKNRPIEQTNLLSRIIRGKENPYQLIPIETYSFMDDSIKVTLFAKEGGNQTERSFHIADVVYPITQKDGNNIHHLLSVEEIKWEENKETIKKQIETDHLSERVFYFGTDKFGRSVLSRLLIGVRVSLLVGLIAVIISLSIGVSIGAIGGYFGGKIDQYVMLLINTVWSIPTLLLVFAIVLALGRGVVNIFIAVGLTMWVDIARIVRGQIMDVKKNSFVEAAHSMGFSSFRIIFKHILPNIIGSILVISAANFATAILIEAGLSYLGFGIQPPTPSWGNMLNENYGYAISGKPFLALFPALSIMSLVLSFNLVGNGLRDAFDNKAK